MAVGGRRSAAVLKPTGHRTMSSVFCSSCSIVSSRLASTFFFGDPCALAEGFATVAAAASAGPAPLLVGASPLRIALG